MSKILEEKLKWYDDNYRQGNALISDAQFDQLEKNLERINPKSDYFIAKNNLILPSLPKDQLKEFLEGLLHKTRLIIEPKIDGCAIGLQYQDGVLTKAISRKGKDVTNKLREVPDLPNNIKVKSNTSKNRFLEMVGVRFGPELVNVLINSEETAIYLAKKFGIPEYLLRDLEERKQIIAMAQQLQQQQAMMQQQGTMDEQTQQ